MKLTLKKYEKPNSLVLWMIADNSVLEASYGKDGEAGSEIDFDNEYDL